MSKKDEPVRPEARLPKGLFDTSASELRATADMLAKIREVFERYGFEPLDTPAIEYTDALGKFLPDQDRPNEGVFSFKDDDEQWLSLRYDLTAPLARYVAENYQNLPKPFRRYQVGPVWRNEKPGPGRFRQFTQFDADTVGASSVAADAELCMLAADTLEALGVPRGQYTIKVSNRRILDGVLEAIGLSGGSMHDDRLAVLRAIDKLDRLGMEGVRQLLGKGRKDESGDFTKGAGLDSGQMGAIEAMFGFDVDIKVAPDGSRSTKLQGAFPKPYPSITDVPTLYEGMVEVGEIKSLCDAAGYQDRIVFDPSVVRGLEYYTGPVFEADDGDENKTERNEVKTNSNDSPIRPRPRQRANRSHPIGVVPQSTCDSRGLFPRLSYDFERLGDGLQYQHRIDFMVRPRHRRARSNASAAIARSSVESPRSSASVNMTTPRSCSSAFHNRVPMFIASAKLPSSIDIAASATSLADLTVPG